MSTDIYIVIYVAFLLNGSAANFITCIFESGVLLICTLEGVSSVANFITCIFENSKGNLLDFYFASLQLVLVP